MEGLWNAKVFYNGVGTMRVRNYTVFGPMILHAIERVMEDFEREIGDMANFIRIECEKMNLEGNVINVKDSIVRE